MTGPMKTAVAMIVVLICGLLALVIEMLRDNGRKCLAVLITCIAVLVVLAALWMNYAYARDLGQWENSDPAVSQWYRSLMQPDYPTSPCCGEADAYWADEVHVRDGKTFAIITDDRDDGPLKRPHIPIGTEIEIPNHKLKWDKSNPTGHGVVFMSFSRHVFCYVQPGGV